MAVAGRYIPGAAGALAVVQYSPPAGAAVRFGALHVPAFGDEMNKSRHVVAAQARAFASLGGVTLVLDPRGTGDSAGEFADASWAGWHEDIVAAFTVLRNALPPATPCVLWGLRLGALAAAEAVCRASVAADALLLWQPVSAGRAFFGQFLRIAAAQRVEEGGPVVTRDELRSALARGEAVEVGGYALTRAHVDAAEALDCAAFDPPAVPVIVREATLLAEPALAPATQRWVDRWRASGTDVDAAAVAAASFWTSIELEDAPSLIASTTAACARWTAAT